MRCAGLILPELKFNKLVGGGEAVYGAEFWPLRIIMACTCLSTSNAMHVEEAIHNSFNMFHGPIKCTFDL